MTRRAFIGAGATAGALTVVPTALARSFAPTASQSLVRSRFAPLVGETLTVTGAGSTFSVVLEQIGDLTPALKVNDPNRFSLLFRVASGGTGASGTQVLRHPAVGRLELFISAVGRGAVAAYYEAVVDRSNN
jgi:hypothetical protein